MGKPFFKYEYKGFGGCECVCDLEVYGNLVICTERADNTGTSITNMAEQLATAVCDSLGISPSKLIWVERYTESSYQSDIDHYDTDERCSFVFFNLSGDGVFESKHRPVEFSNPRWVPIDKRVLDALIDTHGNTGTH